MPLKAKVRTGPAWELSHVMWLGKSVLQGKCVVCCTSSIAFCLGWLLDVSSSSVRNGTKWFEFGMGSWEKDW